MDAVQAFLQSIPAAFTDPAFSSFISSSLGPVSTFYAAAVSSPLAFTSTLLVVATFSCWVGNVTSGYWSWVDRCWSTIPVAYALAFALWPGAAFNARVALMAVLVTLWGSRLTFNFVRKGGYAELEDYRWEVLRNQFKSFSGNLHPIPLELFNLGFVAVYQMVLIFLFTVPPIYLASTSADNGALTALDAALFVLFLALLAGETWADETQWKFQNAKHAMTEAERKKAGGDYALGFCTQGPFRYSRHLNFFCEMSMWWVFYAFTVSAGYSRVNYSVLGTFLLTLLFQGSTWMTEDLSANKYPRYNDYKKTTSRLIPFLPGPALADAGAAAVAAPAKAAAPAAGKARRGSRAAL
jgi:steroid 5-alpha reductase family enzyme